MPRHCAPGRGDGCILLRVLWWHGCVDVDDEKLAHEIDVPDSEGPRGCIDADHAHRYEALAHWGRGSVDCRVVMGFPGFTPRAPAIGNHVGIEEVGYCRSRSVVKCRPKHSVRQFHL